MYCGILQSINAATQTVLANGNVAFPTTTIARGIRLTNNTVTIPYKGLYQITFVADVIPAATASTTVNLLSNNTAIASTTFNGTENIPQRVVFVTLVEVKDSCAAINNAANITVQCVQQCNVLNADLIVEKVR